VSRKKHLKKERLERFMVRVEDLVFQPTAHDCGKVMIKTKFNKNEKEK